MVKRLLASAAFALACLSAAAGIPSVGAQVFIEPGQSSSQVDGWFSLMQEQGMKVCRIRMFEEYMHSGGTWDFSIFDRAFDAAARHGVKIFATLFPADPDRSIGGFKFPFTEQHKRDIADYIQHLVCHYKEHEALLGWVLLNEPGTDGILPDTPYSRSEFDSWLAAHPATDSGGYPKLMDFNSESFLVDHTSDFLGWIAAEIRKYDSSHKLHVNNHQIFDNIAEYNFPAWREFLTSLGASAHPSWHFGYFSRDRYPLALAANCSIVRSGAGPLPYWITELQGGNNTYSAFRAFCPTADEIRQWMLIGIASGIDGLLFWTLNPRAVGGEAGEWGLIDFAGGASDRLSAAGEIISLMEGNPAVFEGITPVNPDVTLLYLRESLWAERKVQLGDLDDTMYEGRHKGGVIKSVLAFYEMLLQNGIGAEISEARELDWNRDDYTGHTIILAGQICLPSMLTPLLRNFVSRGGKLIVEGLSGWYDENMRCTFQTGFDLEDVFGGNLLESKCTPGDFEISVEGTRVKVHLWEGFFEKENRSLRNSYGKGQVLWIPSCIGLGARRSGDYSALESLILPELASAPSVRRARSGITVLNFNSASKTGSLVINKSGRKARVRLANRPQGIVYSAKGARLRGRILRIPHDDSVILSF